MSKPLITEEAAAGLRERDGVADVLARHRVLTIFVAALTLGGMNYVGALFAGVSTPDAAALGTAVAVIVFTFFFVVSVLGGAAAIPDLFRGDNDPPWVDETLSLAQPAAAAEARRRNLAEGNTGAYWIETQMPSGRWSVELRGRRRVADDQDDGSGPSWFYLHLGDGGGGGGGDGGGGAG